MPKKVKTKTKPKNPRLARGVFVLLPGNVRVLNHLSKKWGLSRSEVLQRILTSMAKRLNIPS